jgi:hypothetical protein
MQRLKCRKKFRLAWQSTLFRKLKKLLRLHYTSYVPGIRPTFQTNRGSQIWAISAASVRVRTHLVEF